jgi:hypothetical protein
MAMRASNGCPDCSAARGRARTMLSMFCTSWRTSLPGILEPMGVPVRVAGMYCNDDDCERIE